MNTKKQQFLAGLHAGIPIIIGFIPIGIAFAIMARQAGFTVLQTTGMSITVFAGASQMMAAGMTARLEKVPGNSLRTGRHSSRLYIIPCYLILSL